MFKNCKTFLYTFDLIGVVPQLLIFNNKRYKTILSSVISIIIFLCSLGIIIFSLIQYFKYQKPIISYSKGNDEETERSMILNDSLIMFQLVDPTTTQYINSSIAYFKAHYKSIYDNGKIEDGTLTIERCELGKNINIKYSEIIDGKNKFGRPISEFFCFSFDNNISLFYHPNIGFNSFYLDIIMKNHTNYSPENIQALIVTGNDLIDHNNKNNPINQNYVFHLTTGFSSLEYTTINYNFQYIKYESDDGMIFQKSKIFNGILFSDTNFYKNIRDNYNFKEDIKKSNEITIGNIDFQINKSYYDNYRRTYSRLQTLLAEVTSVISLIFEIGRQLSIILFEKKMKKDIIKSFIAKKEISQNNKKIHLQKNNENDISERKKIKEKINKKEKNNLSDYLDKNHQNKYNENNLYIPKNNIHRNEKISSINIKKDIFKKINVFHIIKSFFCFNDNKTKLINLCCDIINEDMCIERILGRFYKLEKMYNYFSNIEEEKINIIKNKRFKEVNKYIYLISKETDKQYSFKDEKIEKVSSKNNNNQKQKT